jgi:hypothetical protein
VRPEVNWELYAGRTLHPILAELGQPKCGAHAFRRFRLTWLRQNTVPRDLEHFWMGHADEEGRTPRMVKKLVLCLPKISYGRKKTV